MILSEEIKRIAALPKQIRLAGYLKRLAALDELGAILRTGKPFDDKWSPEDDQKWENCCNELEAWGFALTVEERELLKPISSFMACLCRGEDPEEHVKITIKLLPKGKYGKK